MDQNRILPQRGVNVPQYRQYFCTQLKDYQNHILDSTAVYNNVAIFQQSMLDDARLDWLKIGWEYSYQHDDLPEQFSKYVRDGQALINGQMGDYCDPYDRPYIEINEVSPTTTEAFCDPADIGVDGCSDGWVEIYNKGLLPIDLNGFYFSNEEQNLKKHRISAPLVIPPLDRIIIWADGQTSQGVNHLSFKLDNENDFLILSDPAGQLLDSVSWDSLPLGYSIARIPDGAERIETLSGPTPNTENKQESPELSEVSHSPTPPSSEDWVTFRAKIEDEGKFNATLYYQVDGSGFIAFPLTNTITDIWSGTLRPQASGSRVQYYIEAEDLDGLISRWPSQAPETVLEYIVDYQPPTLYINELMASNSTLFLDPSDSTAAPDYIEIYNPGPWAVNLEGMFISDDESQPEKHRLDSDSDQFIIGAGEFKLFLADGNGSAGSHHLGFKLSKGGEDVVLSDRADFGHQVIDSHTFDEQDEEEASGRCWNGGSWEILASPSPGESNTSCGKQPPVLADFTQTPRWPIKSVNNEVVVEITATDDVLMRQTDLSYRTLNGEWTTVPMAKNGDRYTYAIPANLDIGTIIEYYIEAVDVNGHKSQYPVGAPAHLNRFMVHFSLVSINNDFAPPPNLILNELVAVGVQRGISEENEPNEKSAWIEIYNAEAETINLSGYRLAHDLFFPHDYVIPNGVTIAPNGYLTFLLDDDPEQGVYHAAFKPLVSGDTIKLYNRSNILVDEITYGTELATGLVMARIVDGGTSSFELTTCASPGSENHIDCLRNTYIPFVSK